jgi:hypothetical protein
MAVMLSRFDQLHAKRAAIKATTGEQITSKKAKRQMEASMDTPARPGLRSGPILDDTPIGKQTAYCSQGQGLNQTLTLVVK